MIDFGFATKFLLVVVVLPFDLGIATSNFLLRLQAVLCKVTHLSAVKAGPLLIASGKALHDSICHCFPTVGGLGTLTCVFCALIYLPMQVGYGL